MSVVRNPLFLATLALFLCVLLSGCPWCDEDGRISHVTGTIPIQPGATVSFSFHWDGELVAGPGSCGAYWHVDGVEGGNDALGTVDTCGNYTAPETPPLPVVDRLPARQSAAQAR